MSRSETGARAKAAPKKKKRLRKEDIIVEATRLFAERGYEGASMGDLADRVGLRKASLFHHFASKDVLYATVLAELVEAVKKAVFEAASAEGSFAERLDGLSDALTVTLASTPHIARLLVREALDWGPVMRAHLGATLEEVLGAALAFAKAGQKDGALNPDVDAKQLIISLVGVHFMPFAIGEIVERFTGASPFSQPFMEARKKAVREQVRLMALNRKKGR
ncbi:MAG: TetR/AcrR family transcriptional regulator [Myxococcales bacterium]|nr:TetR/AcrR family transcriptional regulator [Myxococcales bacterium]